MSESSKIVAVVGGGPAGLMAAERLARAGVGVNLYDGKPSVGRKLLIAGRGGLNLTHSEMLETFVTRYGPAAARFADLLTDFSPADLRAFAAGLGVGTFVGSSGRVFPVGLRATPLLRAWLARLRDSGVNIHTRHRWIRFDCEGLTFRRPDCSCVTAEPDAVVLALGGASYPHLGSDGAWVELLRAEGVEITSLAPSNCGFEAAWSEAFRERAAGAPLKNLRVSVGEQTADGEIVLTDYGVEGGVVYALSAPLREAIARGGHATLILDLKRDLSLDAVRSRLARPRGKASFATWLRKAVKLIHPAPVLLRETTAPEDRLDPERLAARIKALPIRLSAPRGIAEAISSAGGVAFSELTDDLMLTRKPGVFIAGEMLDYDAPTGGYLLQAAFATGARAAKGVQRYLESDV